MAEYEWDIVVRTWDYYGTKVKKRTSAKVNAATQAEVTTKVRAMFGAKYDDFRKFWSHDWTLNSVRELAAPVPHPAATDPSDGGGERG